MHPTQLDQIIAEGYGNTAGIAVRKDGEPVYQRYFHGFTQDSPIHVYSVTKSVCSALVGIALDRGDLDSVDQPVLDFFPEYPARAAGDSIGQVRLSHLLTMTAPYACQEEPYQDFFRSEDWVRFALDLLGGPEAPGTFRYAPIVGTHLLSGILARATGRSLLEFATETLFAPLGIRVPGDIVLPDEAAHVAFGQGRHGGGWAVDPQGLHTASWGLTLTPQDMAKFGQLYLDGGVWEGRRILPAAWVSESTRAHSRWGKLSYGYLWWVLDDKKRVYAALGDGGNAIYVDTPRRMVVSIASLFVPEAADRLALIRKHIVPMFAA